MSKHTEHCIQRQKWGDGVCECGANKTVSVIRPSLSDDVLSDENALLLAIECRRGIHVGEHIHHHQMEALCCYIIKNSGRMTDSVNLKETQP